MADIPLFGIFTTKITFSLSRGCTTIVVALRVATVRRYRASPRVENAP